MEKIVKYQINIDAMMEVHNSPLSLDTYVTLPKGSLGTLIRSYGNHAKILSFDGVEVIMSDIDLEDKVFSLFSIETEKVVTRKHLTLLK